VYYVAISRARHRAEIYTENLKQLPAAIARLNEKSAALDLEGHAQQLGNVGRASIKMAMEVGK